MPDHSNSERVTLWRRVDIPDDAWTTFSVGTPEAQAGALRMMRAQPDCYEVRTFAPVSDQSEVGIDLGRLQGTAADWGEDVPLPDQSDGEGGATTDADSHRGDESGRAVSECGPSLAAENERAENEWSAYAVTLNQRIERLAGLARRRGIDEPSIRAALDREAE